MPKSKRSTHPHIDSIGGLYVAATVKECHCPQWLCFTACQAHASLGHID